MCWGMGKDEMYQTCHYATMEQRVHSGWIKWITMDGSRLVMEGKESK